MEWRAMDAHNGEMEMAFSKEAFKRGLQQLEKEAQILNDITGTNLTITGNCDAVTRIDIH
jgi:hypothetical protein